MFHGGTKLSVYERNVISVGGIRRETHGCTETENIHTVATFSVKPGEKQLSAVQLLFILFYLFIYLLMYFD